MAVRLCRCGCGCGETGRAAEEKRGGRFSALFIERFSRFSVPLDGKDGGRSDFFCRFAAGVLGYHDWVLVGRWVPPVGGRSVAISGLSACRSICLEPWTVCCVILEFSRVIVLIVRIRIPLSTEVGPNG